MKNLLTEAIDVLERLYGMKIEPIEEILFINSAECLE